LLLQILAVRVAQPELPLKILAVRVAGPKLPLLILAARVAATDSVGLSIPLQVYEQTSSSSNQ
jgi:hypothetical protein